MVVNVYFTAVTNYNISRHELLAWVNDCLQSNLTKIEEMSTGAAYIQLTDLCFRGQISLKKVKWNSKNDVDWVNNWQILQKAWKEIGIDKPVPVQALMKGKFQDNFEFLQWFRRLFDANYDGSSYNPLEARGFEEFPAPLPGGNTRAAAASRPAPKANTSISNRSTTVSTPAAPTRATATKNATQLAPSVARATTQAAKPTKNGAPASSTAAAAGSASATNSADLKKLKTENEELQSQLVLFGETVASLEKERDFYFGKLRQIELLCTELGENAPLTTNQITQILYETEDGFVQTNDDEVHLMTHSGEEDPKPTLDSTFTLEHPSHVEVPIPTNGHTDQHKTSNNIAHDIQDEVFQLEEKRLQEEPIPDTPVHEDAKPIYANVDYHNVNAHGELDNIKVPQQVIDLDDSETF